jgi:hypothetical protein
LPNIYGHSDFCKQNQVLTRVVLQPSIRIFYKTLIAFIPDELRWLGSNHFGVFNETMLVPEFPSHGLTYLVITLFY